MVENADRELHFHDYFKVIRNRLWVIFTIFALTVSSGWYVTEYVLPKIYSASSQIQIQPRGVVVEPGLGGGATDRGFDATTFQAEFEIMQSPDVLLPIITDLGLDKTWARRVYKSNLDKLPDLEALGYMGRVLKLDYKRGTNIIEITAQSEVPEEAAAIANALANRYQAIRDQEQTQRNGQGADALRQQIADQEKVVADRKAAVEKLRQQAYDQGVDIVPSAGGSVGRIDQDLDKRKQDLLAAQQEYDAGRVLLASVINLPDDQFISTLVGLGGGEPDIDALRAEVFKMESDMDNLLKDGFEENHPSVLALKAALERKRRQITELIAGKRRAMQVQTDIAKSKVEMITRDVDELKMKSLEEQKSALVPYRDALRDSEAQQGILEALNVRLQQVLSERPLLESPVRIIALAKPPTSPSKPNKTLNLAVSVLAGLFVGIVVAFLIEYLDTSVKTMAEAEQLLGLPVLTVIPNKGGPLPLTREAARLPHAEGYRILRAKLDLKVQNGIGPSLALLSGGPGEGKSTTIYNLAVVCAQAGQSVILVDCDLRRPTLHTLLKLPNDHGLSDYLRGQGPAVDFIQQTAIPTLQALTAGDMPLSDIGVLAGDKIRQLLDDLKQRYDLVLVDAPPVLGISDGSIIAREVDHVLLVIQHRRYPREISLRAKRGIEEVHGNCIGLVLNAVSAQSDDAYYYYSSYGNYYKKTDRKKRREKQKQPHGANGKPRPAPTRKTDLDSEEF